MVNLNLGTAALENLQKAAAENEKSADQPATESTEFKQVNWTCKRYPELTFQLYAEQKGKESLEAKFTKGRFICDTQEEATRMEEAMERLARTAPSVRVEIQKIDRAAAEAMARRSIKQMAISGGFSTAAMLGQTPGSASLINEMAQNGVGDEFIQSALDELNQSSQDPGSN